MTLNRLTVHGFLRFLDPVTLDLTTLPEGLIAIVGPNGAGKTTLLEGAFAALYRRWVSRGELAPYASGKDSYLEADYALEGRGTVRARVNVDGIRRASDAVLTCTPPGGPTAALNDGKATTFDAAVRALFPSADLLKASAFAAQNKDGDFITRRGAQRRELLAELLGLGALTTMGQTAKTLAGLVEGARGRLLAQREVLARDTTPALLATLTASMQAADEEILASREHRRVLEASITELDARLGTMADAVAAHAALTQRIARLQEDLTHRRLEASRLAAERQQADRTRDREQQLLIERRGVTVADLDAKLAGNAQIQVRATEIRAAAAIVTRLEAELVEARAAVDQARDVEAQASTALTDVERRLAALVPLEQRQARAQRDVALIDRVPCHGEAAYAGCEFLADARQAQADLAQLAAALAPQAALAEEVGQRRRALDAAAAALQATRRDVGALASELAVHVSTAGYLPKLEASEDRVKELQERRADVLRQAEADIDAVGARHAQTSRDLDARATDLEVRIAQLTTDLDLAQRNLDALQDGAQAAVDLQAELRRARADRDRVVGSLAAAEATAADLRRRRQEFVGKQQVIAALEARVATLEAELVDWQLLARALAKDGLPELEIDAAGPTISAYTNELLEVCHGTRFSLELVTQVARADGKGMKDELTVRVTDNASGGIARDIADLSGGEQVIVSEALRNAIGIYVNRRSALPIRTCWRDETTGALDPDNAGRYLQMLRTVQRLGGYRHILFITHNPDAAAQADAQVRLTDGQAAVCLPPYATAA